MLHISLKSPLGTWNKRMRVCVRACMYVCKNGGFRKQFRQKRLILSLPSAFLGVLVWTTGENASKDLSFRSKPN